MTSPLKCIPFSVSKLEHFKNDIHLHRDIKYTLTLKLLLTDYLVNVVKYSDLSSSKGPHNVRSERWSERFSALTALNQVMSLFEYISCQIGILSLAQKCSHLTLYRCFLRS